MSDFNGTHYSELKSYPTLIPGLKQVSKYQIASYESEKSYGSGVPESMKNWWCY